MKITIYTPIYWPGYGGTQTAMRLYAEHFARQGHEVTVLTSQMKDISEASPKNPRRSMNFPETEVHEGVRIRRFPSGGPVDLLLGLLFMAAQRLRLPTADIFELYWLRRFRARKIVRFLRESPPDVFIVAPCMDWLLKIGIDGSRASKAPLVMKTCLHLTSPVYGQRKLDLLNECAAVLANTPFEMGYLERSGIDRAKLHDTGEPLDIRTLRAVTPTANDPRVRALEGKKFVLFIGLKEEGKGVGELVRVFQSQADGLSGASLVLVGGNSHYFETQIRPTLRKEHPILDLGAVDDSTKMWLLKHCTVFSMVSSVDSFGIAYLEAWFAGTPVIAADFPAMRCVIEDGVNGLLVPYGDETKLREALSRLLSDPAYAKKLADAGHQKVMKDFTDFACEKKVEKILTKVAAKSG